MSTELINRRTATRAKSLIAAQLAATCLLSLILLGWYWPESLTAAYSAFVGGMIATLANAWFALKVFSSKYEDEPGVVLRVFYWGELNKILLTCAMFAGAFVLVRPVNAAALLGTYFLVHMTPAVVSMIGRMLKKNSIY